MNVMKRDCLCDYSIVLLPIICLSLLRGISSTVDSSILYTRVKSDHSWNTLEYYGILNTVGVIPGILLVPFMIDVYGRKPAFTLLFFLSLLYFIIHYFPYQMPLFVIGNFIVAIIKGGVKVITTLAICEYCGPKHRFAYIVADETVKILSAQVTNILYATGVLSVALPYVSSCAAVIALTCMVSVYWWPESPYWLASQGRVEESRASLLWLRAESDAARAELQALGTAGRAKLFCLALLVAVLFVIVATCSSSAKSILITLDRDNESVERQSSLNIAQLFGNIAISLLLVLMSYKLKRKVVYFVALVIPLVLLLILTIWVHVAQLNNNAVAFYVTVLICSCFIDCGPISLSFALCIEVIPQKYYSYISCICSICLYLSALYFPILSLQYRFSFPLYISLYLFTALALVAMMLIHWLAPETRGKNLLEIEKKYIDRHISRL